MVKSRVLEGTLFSWENGSIVSATFRDVTYSCFSSTYVHSATRKTHPNRQAAFAEILAFALALALICFTLAFVVLRFLT